MSQRSQLLCISSTRVSSNDCRWRNINCSGKCNKINLTMGEYVMNSPMIAIPMGGVDVVLGIQWLQSLGTVAFNFQELFMKFSLEGK
jgi:hypothetical protein